MSKLKPSVSNKPPSRKTPSQLPHALQYGLEVVMRDKGGKVSSVRCCFCRYFGREEAQHGKRKRTQNVNVTMHPEIQVASAAALTGEPDLEYGTGPLTHGHPELWKYIPNAACNPNGDTKYIPNMDYNLNGDIMCNPNIACNPNGLRAT
ncbi:hypothetical protein PHMEG_00015503 [Phytophthora megakarya]|uniref:Uncharacterized protein n=1 Tax=Phytophthora megakarya TaxID=4795 RepID=A0A225W1M1_9STRA|nr:hypothetical protein PHMEG_00015503 [Phytophthora megakarya]